MVYITKRTSYSDAEFTWLRIDYMDPLFMISILSYSRYYANQKKTLEINPRHPLIKELRSRVDTDKEDQTTKDLAEVLFEAATLRSGYVLQDTAAFSDRIERMLRLSMDISLDEGVSKKLVLKPRLMWGIMLFAKVIGSVLWRNHSFAKLKFCHIQNWLFVKTSQICLISSV